MNDRIKYRMQGMSGSFNDPPPEYNGSKSSRRSNMGRRASEYIINVPVTQLKKIGATKEINSLYRETQHFVGG
uniref:Ovule protein n=1 Tax=Panagrellus redivivus TaxID=6233 RepID=A0A7E4VTQ7_PANRE